MPLRPENSSLDQGSFFRALIEGISEIVCVTDAERIIRYVNPAVRNVLGYEPEAMLGRHGSEFLQEGSRDAFAIEINEQTRSSIQVQAIRVSARHQNGELRILAGTATNMLDDPQIQGTAYHLQDVTALERLEEQVQQVARLDSVGRLAGGIAHDLNNVLTVVLGQVELLQRRGGDERLQAGLKEIRAAGTRASAMVTQLLAFARRSVVTPRSIAIADVVKAVTPLFNGLLGEDVELRTSIPPGLGTVTADPMQLEQILIHLAANAKEAMPEGGRLDLKVQAVTLTAADAEAMGYARSGAHALISVKDNGRGIEADILPHIFEPFFLAARRGKGNGLGLSMVYGMVKQAGGHIRAESASGLGTCFNLWLPMNEPGGGVALPGPAMVDDPPEIDGTGRKILVCEDEGQVLAVVKEGLQLLGFEVHATKSALKAIEWLGQGLRPELLVTDVVMPQMNGERLAEEALRLFPGLRVIFMSGYAPSAVARQGLMKKGENFISKPFSIAELAALIGPARA